MPELFYIDNNKNREICWESLIADINSTKEFCPYIHDEDYYQVFKQIIISLLLNQEVTLVDSDFSSEELQGLFDGVKLVEKVPVKIPEIGQDRLSLIKKLTDSDKSNWRITLFTSGTTGLPKKVSHTFESISRFVHKSERHNDDVWGYAYNATHMAGVQVFFQALMNGNTIVKLFKESRQDIFDLIRRYSVTHISSTPTFYRLLLPSDSVFPSVKRLTSGGEKFDSTTLASLNSMFPNAKITNVYASTEAGTLFASKGDTFILKAAMDGLVKVENGLLYIHKTLLGQSESIKLEGDWYKTGDIVDVINDSPLEFKFVSRQNEMINVGGYKVNPEEVEQALREIDSIKDVVVYAKPNRLLGNVVCCDIIPIKSETIDELAIRKYLSTRLQDFKIPRLFKIVDEISTTRSGKVKRVR